jgi:hypothetical protein
VGVNSNQGSKGGVSMKRSADQTQPQATIVAVIDSSRFEPRMMSSCELDVHGESSRPSQETKLQDSKTPRFQDSKISRQRNTSRPVQGISRPTSRQVPDPGASRHPFKTHASPTHPVFQLPIVNTNHNNVTPPRVSVVPSPRRPVAPSPIAHRPSTSTSRSPQSSQPPTHLAQPKATHAHLSQLRRPDICIAQTPPPAPPPPAPQRRLGFVKTRRSSLRNLTTEAY